MTQRNYETEQNVVLIAFCIVVGCVGLLVLLAVWWWL
jgi:hypothetical protein